MKHLKSWLAAALVLSLTLFAAACGGGGSSTSGGSSSGGSSGGSSTSSASGSSEPAKKASSPTYVLKFNHVLSESEPFHQGFLKWAEAVEERTNGDFVIEVFPSAQLGVEEDIIEQLKEGANIGQNTDSARLGMYVPEIAVLNAPYLVDSIDEVVKLNDSPAVKEWLEQLENEHNIKVLSFNWVQGLRHVVANKPIYKPEDLDGMRIRTPGAPIWQESVRAIGASPTAMAFGEIYVGMQQGAVDGAELVYRNVTGGKLYEVAKYVSETSHIMLINFQVIGKKFFDSLPKEYQDILIEECDKAGLEISRMMEAEAEELKKEIQTHGVTIIPTSEIDIDAFRQAGEAAYHALDLIAARDRVFADLGK